MGTVNKTDDFVSSCAQRLAQEQIRTDWPGNSSRQVKNQWVVYYSEDGEKRAQVVDEIRLRRWWTNDKGEFCEIGNSPG